MQNTGLKILLHASTWFAPFLVPFILYLVVDDDEVKKLSIQAVLFQLVMYFLITVSVFLIIFLIGIPMLIIFGIMAFVVPIIGIIKAINGDKFNYPIVGSWIK
ncbi:DUF4870 domain-containing protein [Psychrobacillus lasiicapitis]|uniref:DUF4870 domain-containing protein n=1 Tax=Psychrobacillus lasiicapitis TaxID=1636719 RepID=A0A544THA3_9BACI|nr:DUF4870 domain-containing protein [Psychrobacillus lasiicapitis]TQR16839.1 DUF4870 domain-containing protein [Psychrobacillus lasiicapitis]GGA26726.1 hypothetical protein GCM10011384_15050 [Psychrobacillus lasiicapitis]